MVTITAHAVSRIGSEARERLEDFSAHRYIERTAGGLKLQLAVVCDGVGSSDWGIRAARLTTESVFAFIEESLITNVPELLVEAIEAANVRVIEEIPSGEGNTTIALMAVLLGDPEAPYGKLFIASVGDSPIFLAREGELTRLNTDHNVATEKLLDGEITADDLPYVEDGHKLTRAIGLNYNLDVDIGFYARGASRSVARKRGEVGLKLQEGDTVFATSDGMTDQNPEDGLPFVHDDEFLRHAIDKNVEMATNTLVSYAESRGPLDNVSLAMIFIDGKQRKNVAALGAGMSSRAKVLIFGAFAALALIACGVAFAISQQGQAELNLAQQTADAERVAAIGTQSVIEATNTAQGNIFATQTVVAGFTDTPTPTPTPTNTPTPTITPTFTLTPTIRPTLSVNAVGIIYGTGDLSLGEAQRRALIDPVTSARYAVIDGNNELPEPANIYLLANTSLTFDDADAQEIDIILEQNGDVFVDSGQYQEIRFSLRQDRNITFSSNGACLAVYYQPPPPPDVLSNQVTFSCYGENSICQLSLPGGDQPIEGGTRLTVDVSTQQLVGDAEPLDYTEAVKYHTVVTELLQLPPDDNSQVPDCLLGLADPDRDGFVGRFDACVFDRGIGSRNGCPPVTATPEDISSPTRTPTSVPATPIPPTPVPPTPVPPTPEPPTPVPPTPVPPTPVPPTPEPPTPEPERPTIIPPTATGQAESRYLPPSAILPLP